MEKDQSGILVEAWHPFGKDVTYFKSGPIPTGECEQFVAVLRLTTTLVDRRQYKSKYVEGPLGVKTDERDERFFAWHA